MGSYTMVLTITHIYVNIYIYIYLRTCEQHTYIPGNIFLLEKGETMLALGSETFRAPVENRTKDLPNSRSDVLTTEPPGL